MFRKLLLYVFLVAALTGLSGFAFAIGGSSQERVEQTLLIKGRGVDGVMIMQDGAAQRVSCPSPQPYVTADGTSTGWACFDPATGTWLMNADKQSSTVYAQPPAYFVPSPVYNYYGFPYPYPYYPYYYGGPLYWNVPSIQDSQ